MRIDSTLRAIDPVGCGCTDCLTGTYKPLDRATDDQIQAMFLGIVSDHTGDMFTITQTDDNRFHVCAGNHDDHTDGDTYTFTIDKLAFPITVDKYILDVDLDLIVANLVHLAR